MPGSPHPLWERWRCIQLLVVLNSLRCWLELFESLVFGFVWSLWTPFPVVFSHFFFIEVSSKTWKPLRPFPTYQNWRMMQNDECCVSISHIRVCLMKTMWRVREEYEDLIHRFFSKSHQEEQFPFATSTHFSFFQAMISLSVIPCPRAPWQQGGARFLRKPHRCAKTIRLQQVHRSSMEAFHLRELRSFILNEVLYIFDIFIFDFVLFIKWFIFVGTQPRCRSTAAATGPWPGAKVFSDHGNAQEGVENLKCKKRKFWSRFKTSLHSTARETNFSSRMTWMTLSLLRTSWWRPMCPRARGHWAWNRAWWSPLYDYDDQAGYWVLDCLWWLQEINYTSNKRIVTTAPRQNCYFEIELLMPIYCNIWIYVDDDNVQVGWAEAARDPQL